jgi:uncharacterized protein (TIGR02246 family)
VDGLQKGTGWDYSRRRILKKGRVYKMKRMIILVLLLAVAGCAAPEVKQETQKTADPQADKAAIDKLRDDFMAAFNAGDAAKIGELYSENALAMGGDRPTLQGPAAIVESNKTMFDQFTAKITITPTQTKTSGDLAYDQGTYTLELTPKAKGGKPAKEEGRYVVVLQREGDAWKVVADIDNKNPPPPPPSAKK